MCCDQQCRNRAWHRQLWHGSLHAAVWMRSQRLRQSMRPGHPCHAQSAAVLQADALPGVSLLPLHINPMPAAVLVVPQTLALTPWACRTPRALAASSPPSGWPTLRCAQPLPYGLAPVPHRAVPPYAFFWCMRAPVVCALRTRCVVGPGSTASGHDGPGGACLPLLMQRLPPCPPCLDTWQVIHCRWAMLGAAGFLAPEILASAGVIPASPEEAVWFRSGVIPPAGQYGERPARSPDAARAAPCHTQRLSLWSWAGLHALTHG